MEKSLCLIIAFLLLSVAVFGDSIDTISFNHTTSNSFISGDYTFNITTNATDVSIYYYNSSMNATLFGSNSTHENQTLYYSDTTKITDDVYTFIAYGFNSSNASNNVSATITNVTIDNQPPSTPVLLTPANGSSSSDHTPTFSWSATDNTSGIERYFLYLEYMNASGEQCSGTLNFTSDTVTAPGALNATYYWKVRARDNAGNSGSWSNVLQFTVTHLPQFQVLNSSLELFPESTQTLNISIFDEYAYPIYDLNSSNVRSLTLTHNETGEELSINNFSLTNSSDFYLLSFYLPDIVGGQFELDLALNETNSSDIAHGKRNVTVNKSYLTYSESSWPSSLTVDGSSTTWTLTVTNHGLNETNVTIERSFSDDGYMTLTPSSVNLNLPAGNSTDVVYTLTPGNSDYDNLEVTFTLNGGKWWMNDTSETISKTIDINAADSDDGDTGDTTSGNDEGDTTPQKTYEASLDTELSEDELELLPGEQGSVLLTLENYGDYTLEDIQVSLPEVNESWYSLSDNKVDLEPQMYSGVKYWDNINITFDIPEDAEPGVYEGIEIEAKYIDGDYIDEVGFTLEVSLTPEQIDELSGNYESLLAEYQELLDEIERKEAAGEDVSELKEELDEVKELLDDAKTALDNEDYITAYASMRDADPLLEETSTKIGEILAAGPPSYLLWLITGIILFGGAGFGYFYFLGSKKTRWSFGGGYSKSDKFKSLKVYINKLIRTMKAKRTKNNKQSSFGKKYKKPWWKFWKRKK